MDLLRTRGLLLPPFSPLPPSVSVLPGRAPRREPRVIIDVSLSPSWHFHDNRRWHRGGVSDEGGRGMGGVTVVVVSYRDTFLRMQISAARNRAAAGNRSNRAPALCDLSPIYPLPLASFSVCLCLSPPPTLPFVSLFIDRTRLSTRLIPVKKTRRTISRGAVFVAVVSAREGEHEGDISRRGAKTWRRIQRTVCRPMLISFLLSSLVSPPPHRVTNIQLCLRVIDFN